MKRSSIKTTIALLALTLLTACSQRAEYLPPKCASVKPIKRVADVNVTTDSRGGLDPENTKKVFILVGKLRVKESYYDTETTRLWGLNNGEL